MAKRKKGKVIQMLSPEQYIRQKARTLPIHECLINSEWEADGMANITITRRHSNNNFTVGMYLVDLKCLGVKDTHSLFNVSPAEYRELIDTIERNHDLESIPYNLAHNIVFAGLEFADDYGFKPHSDFSLSQYILEEDTDDIELIDITCGENGKPLYVRGPMESDLRAAQILAQLEKTAGPGNFDFVNAFDDEWMDDDEFDESDDDIIPEDEELIDEWAGREVEISPRSFQFKIQLQNISKPPVWRKLVVPSNFTFFEFHASIQVAFGWLNEHMFQFCPKGYGSYPQIKQKFDDDLSEMEFGRGEVFDADETMLSSIFHEENQKFTYIYDFGDDWKHTITLEKILDEPAMYPKLVDGKGKCPPEDCGGPWGYERLKEILSNPDHPEYNESKEWYLDEDEESFDPVTFAIEEHRDLLRLVFSDE